MDNCDFLIISYEDIEYDGRLRELISCFKKIGNIKIFTKKKQDNSNICYNNYLMFVIKSIIFGLKNKRFDCLVIINRKATIPGLIIKKIFKSKIVIMDCYELYLKKETKNITGIIGCYFEEKLIKLSNIVIVANEERARIAKIVYKLKNNPIVYENIRKLEYSKNNKNEYLKNKFNEYLIDGEIRIISTSGCDISRTNDILVENANKIKKKCKIFLVGKSSKKDIEKIKKIIKRKKIDNIIILDQLKQDELKYLITKCDIGIVNYGKFDTNNKYCASGKLFEFLFEKLPVVTTTNPPLRRMVCKNELGICDDEYYNGINIVSEHYDYYAHKVSSFITKCSVQFNNDCLSEQIKERLDEITK